MSSSPPQAGPQIQLDHFLIWHSHYELGHLYERMGQLPDALRHYEIAASSALPLPPLSGASSVSTPRELTPSPFSLQTSPQSSIRTRRWSVSSLLALNSSACPAHRFSPPREQTGKYSLQSALALKCSASIDMVKERQKKGGAAALR